MTIATPFFPITNALKKSTENSPTKHNTRPDLYDNSGRE